MSVYIEYVLLDNLVINCIIIILSAFALKLEVKKVNVILSSLLGTLFAVFMPFIILPNGLLILLKLMIGFVMVSLFKQYKNWVQMLMVYLTFLFFTFLLGGVCFGLMLLTNANIENATMLVYYGSLPMGVLLLIISISSYFIFNLFKQFYKKKLVNNFIFDVSICNNHKVCKTKAFLDSGNRLVNKATNSPIVVVNYYVFNKLFEGVKLTDILLGKLANLPLKKVEFINVSSVGNSKNKMLIFEIDKIEIKLENEITTINNITLGLTLNKFKDEIAYNALLNPALLNF